MTGTNVADKQGMKHRLLRAYHKMSSFKIQSTSTFLLYTFLSFSCFGLE